MATANRKRMTVRVVGNVLVQELVSANGAKTKEWGSRTVVNQHELVTKEFDHNAGLRRALKGFKKEDMKMVDENTVIVTPAKKQNEMMKVEIVYSVLRYSSQCPECGAPASKPNDWCELCMAQQAGRQATTFDPVKGLDALLAGEVEAEGDDEE